LKPFTANINIYFIQNLRYLRKPENHLFVLCYVNITIRFTCVGVAEQVDEKD